MKRTRTEDLKTSAARLLRKEDFEREVQHILDQLVRDYRPERVILFGSLVSGRITEGTDIDLFIIKRDVPVHGVDRIREIQRMVKYTLATDFIVYTPEEVEKRLAVKDPFVLHAIHEGKVLYRAQ